MDESENRYLRMGFKKLDELLVASYYRPYEAKSISESRSSRLRARRLYHSEEHNADMHVEMLRLLSCAVCQAPSESEELTLAYRDRSILLMHLQRYKEAFMDLDKLMDLPLSDEDGALTICRKVECEAELGLWTARVTCQGMQYLFATNDLDERITYQIQARLALALVKLRSGRIRGSDRDKAKVDLPNPDKITKHQSDEIPNASSCRVNHNPAAGSYRYGRHLVTTRNVLPGDIFYCGQAYVVLPSEAAQHLNCWHCLRFAWHGVPCDHCSQVIYCTYECRESAWQLFHRFECPIVGRTVRFIDLARTSKLMALRMLIKAMLEVDGQLETLKKHCREIDKQRDRRTRGFTDGMFLPNHRSCYSLLANVEGRDDEVREAIATETAAILYHIAKYTNLFPGFEADIKKLQLNEDAMFVARLLSHFQHVVKTNATMYTETKFASTYSWEWQNNGDEADSTATYLDPAMSLINHSCFPNVARCETKDGKNILYALRPIAEGEQLFECYGPTYSECEKKYRDNLLSQSNFTCRCIACEDDWPIYAYMQHYGMSYSTKSPAEMSATENAMKLVDRYYDDLKEDEFAHDPRALNDIAYAIYLVIMFTELPNWRLEYLMATFITAFDELYSYVLEVPNTCHLSDIKPRIKFIPSDDEEEEEEEADIED
ncbi:SET and MYND domain-containing protein 4-like [Trichogramma pretiosum]|uniref:SET and MYND domain-containing protein 4-like n=1 Tax=Trichogramma pretiosum TaxID=7493 RepID=UPI0006C9CB5E|nr:SET and MYND domain-containing protein 4-like [Trichogramma pretiosum]